ncbi:MAG: hypothetical protein RBT16_10280 [Desulfococcus multivorans]|nr:hypothetical protein [Desulfococcus multivorans]
MYGRLGMNTLMCEPGTALAHACPIEISIAIIGNTHNLWMVYFALPI